MTIILKTDPNNPDPLVLDEAAKILRNGGIVAFPTETVYGLGGVVYNEDAVKKIFWAKKRPIDNPLIVHVSSLSMLEEVAVNIPEKAYLLIERFWPGPLTLILPRNPKVPRIVTSGLDIVAVRMPAHPVALELIKKTESPIAAPSANLAGRPSPTSAEHVIRDLYGRVDAIIDAGETIYGVESTIINILTRPPTLLRPGAFAIEDLERVLGEKIYIPSFARGLGEAEHAIAPGMKYLHYSPEASIILVEPASQNIESIVEKIKTLASSYLEKGVRVCVVASTETIEKYTSLKIPILNIGSRSNMFEVARNLFKTLRKLDDLGCIVAIIEGFEDKGLGLAVMNRLRKASREIIHV
ncbi:MAG: threonylcarbamoyl-AMP synthase [Desulfurococcaceae archaeon]|nr:threonylcarbamoyl-AMP synthase [Desulfurococcaceae archaeon]